MDVPSEYRASKPSQKRRPKGTKAAATAAPPPQPSPYFNDFAAQNQQQYMSNLGQPDMFYGGQGYGPSGYGGTQFPGQQLLNDPVANMAMQYGQSLAGQGKDLVQKNLENYVTSSKLKYYFAVDTAYVGKKLGLLFFPYTHSDWSIHYNQDEPVAPRYEINAPDLYIPVMAFVTYILVAGMVLGTQGRFTPEQLGAQASSALVWLIIEMVGFTLSLYILNLNTDLKYLDIIAYCGYKFVGMNCSLLAGVASNTTVYYFVLLWFCISLVFFLMRTLRVQVMPHQTDDGFTKGAKRSLYLILSVSLAQPLLMWWLTSYVMIFK
ncbi:protein YIF1B-B-like [Physella acuta]|uniref:protein YIF1B-B-like n=1 Tax=Physella acuta TaxID=109671 RepID=UPI0027DD9124|nr:protein YIF1B-B-like [Physella acuta]XP_059161059.1 protein YIF1B-B-like [Physella acuta]XP_059161060.1 protein YIF1B-B-like [Physella acuta]